MKLKAQAAVLLAVAALVGCGEQEFVPQTKLGKKYPLLEWPDSAYVASLDSILAAEPLKKASKDSNKTELVLGGGKAPMLALPAAKKAEPKPQKAATESKPQTTTTKQKAGASFTERFSRALDRWQSDPNNKSLYVTTEARPGEDAIAALSRVYGREARQLPRFYTLSVLQALNPGISVENPAAGDVLKLPKVGN